MHRINDIQYLGVYTYTIHTYIYNTIGVDPPIWKYWRKFGDGENRKNSKTNFSNIYLNAVLR